MRTTGAVTRILSAIEGGDPHATEQLLPLAFDEPRFFHTFGYQPGPRSD
jgi:hypothetical protein